MGATRLSSSFARLGAPRARPSVDTDSRLSAVSILDEFSHECLAPEMTLWPVHPLGSRQDLRLIRPDMVLVESAWSGNNGRWRYQVTSPVGPKKPLLELIDEARSLAIPVVFWNKEDPPHHEDFLPFAKLADLVLTTEGRLLDKYVAAGVPSVDVMQFAASPRLHTPAAVTGFRNGDVCFAGQYFRHKYPERREQMDLLFSAAKKHDFTIYSRALGGAPDYQFPESYHRYVRSPLPYSEMTQEYKRHKVFLNVNSVPDSPTMCARRIFELASSKTAVMTTPSPAITSVFPDGSVAQVRSEAEAQTVLTQLLTDDWLRRRTVQQAWRRVADEHLYADRVHRIARLLGLPHEEWQARLTVVLDTRGAGLERALETVVRQTGVLFDEVVILDRELDATELTDARARTGLPLRGHSDSMPLGHVVASMSTEHEYGNHYLHDQVVLLGRYAVGDVVTKPRWQSLVDEESYVGTFSAGTWVARGAVARRLLAEEAAGRRTLTQRAYASDPLNLRHAMDRPPTDWEA
jgi:hypothetical protein